MLPSPRLNPVFSLQFAALISIYGIPSVEIEYLYSVVNFNYINHVLCTVVQNLFVGLLMHKNETDCTL